MSETIGVCEGVPCEALHDGIRAVVSCELRRTAATLQGYLPQTLARDTFPSDLTEVLDRAARRWDANMPLARASDVRSRPLLGLNGQYIKASILLHLMRRLDVDCFVETGTKNGFTSLLVLAQTNLRVLTCEIDRDRYETAGTLLRPFGDRCQTYLQDKQAFIDDVLCRSDLTAPFFYLDAHDPNVSLRSEMARILSCERLDRFVIVVDDFKVPWDSGFVYDNYARSAVDLEDIAPALASSVSPVVVMGPAYPAALDTGYPAGFVVIVPAAMKPLVDGIVPPTLLRIATH